MEQQHTREFEQSLRQSDEGCGGCLKPADREAQYRQSIQLLTQGHAVLASMAEAEIAKDPDMDPVRRDEWREVARQHWSMSRCCEAATIPPIREAAT